jgi:SHS2 domain-containing protein
MSDFELLAHTADVGLRARGATLEETFEAATRGLASILGAWRPGPGEAIEVSVEPGDLAGQLVDWLSEVLYLQDSRDAVIAGVRVAGVGDDGTTGAVMLAPRGDEVLEGTAVKAITYHQLRVERSESGWVAELYVDV